MFCAITLYFKETRFLFIFSYYRLVSPNILWGYFQLIFIIKKQSAGCDLLRVDDLKYAPDLLYEEIAELLNNVIDTGEFQKELKIRLLVPIQKPGKKMGQPENLELCSNH